MEYYKLEILFICFSVLVNYKVDALKVDKRESTYLMLYKNGCRPVTGDDGAVPHWSKQSDFTVVLLALLILDFTFPFSPSSLPSVSLCKLRKGSWGMLPSPLNKCTHFTTRAECFSSLSTYLARVSVHHPHRYCLPRPSASWLWEGSFCGGTGGKLGVLDFFFSSQVL